MNAAVVLVVCGILFFLAYKYYAGFLGRRVFELDASRITPAHTKKDGVDFIPTNKFVLMGHHFASITGAAPIVGPAIAVIYGWVPALLWVVFGTIFMGAVSDFSALVISIRNEGRTLGDIVKDLIGGRGRILFLLLGICLFVLLLAVFPIIIAGLLMSVPESVFPSFALIPIAILMGFMMYKGNVKLPIVTFIGLGLMAAAFAIGLKVPMGQGVDKNAWIAILLFYSFIASVVPVWVLLQPRDYLNSFWLYLGLGLLVLGIFLVRPEIQAPAVRPSPPGTENIPMFPFLFIMIACGALSGVHALFASGTTSRQLDKETDAPMIGYGGMVLEGCLAVIAIIACTAGVDSKEAWLAQYASFETSAGLQAKLGAFVSGGGMFLNQGMGIPLDFAKMFISVTVIGFALTTLDSSARIIRFMTSELGAATKVPSVVSKNRYVGAAVCCVIAYLLATQEIAGKSTGLLLWPTFGVSNQVLACLGLLVASLYLYKLKKPVYFTLIPMAIMLVVTMYALCLSLRNWYGDKNWMLVTIGAAVLLCEVWLVIEAIVALKRMSGTPEAEPVAEGAEAS